MPEGAKTRAPAEAGRQFSRMNGAAVRKADMPEGAKTRAPAEAEPAIQPHERRGGLGGGYARRRENAGSSRSGPAFLCAPSASHASVCAKAGAPGCALAPCNAGVRRALRRENPAPSAARRAAGRARFARKLRFAAEVARCTPSRGKSWKKSTAVFVLFTGGTQTLAILVPSKELILFQYRSLSRRAARRPFRALRAGGKDDFGSARPSRNQIVAPLLPGNCVMPRRLRARGPEINPCEVNFSPQVGGRAAQIPARFCARRSAPLPQPRNAAR